MDTVGSSSGMNVSTLLYVIDKMPEVKTKIQKVLLQTDLEEQQKVELIAHLLKSSNQSSSSTTGSTSIEK